MLRRRSARAASFALGLGFLFCSVGAVERKSHIRSRHLETVFHVSSVQGSGEQCRCEYPGEHLYDPDSPSTATFVKDEDGSLVFPNSHSACENVWFICPDVEFSGTPWTYECPTDGQDGQRRTTTHLNRQPTIGRPYYTKEGVSDNEFPNDFHHLVDEGGPPTEYYVVLSRATDFCKSGGTRIRSGEIPLGECASQVFAFDKAGDRRPLPGGASVGSEWFPNLGVKITANSDGGPDNMHPVVFDMTNRDSNGVAHSRAAELGPHDEVGNVLVPLRQEGAQGADDDYGMLNFDFYEKTYVNYITLLNVNDLGKLYVTQADGKMLIYRLESVGPGGVQTLELGLENVIKITVVFKSFAAVVSMDLCIVRIHD